MIAQHWIPEPYMRRAVKFLLEHASAGLLLDPGLCKTSITLAAFKLLLHEQVAQRMLVIAPLRPAYLVWPAEVAKWLEFNHLKISVLHGPHRERRLEEGADIFVINPEGLEWLDEGRNWRKLGADTLALDESTKFKHTQTRRFESLRPQLPKFARRWILTGLPSPNGLLDLFGQVYVIDLGKTFTPMFSHYRHHYFAPTGHGGYSWEIKEGAEERIYKMLRPYVMRLEAEDYIKMPRFIERDRFVELPPKARTLYNKLEDELFLNLDEGNVTAVNAGALSGKCRQLACGGLYLDQEPEELASGQARRVAQLHEAKTEALLELRDELHGQPLLVAYHWKHDLDRLRRALGKKVPVLGGGTLKEDARLEAAWNANELPVMLGHPASVGHGLNLQTGGAHHIAWYTPTWDYELYDQFNRRLRRRGQKHGTVTAHRLIARDTVEEAVVTALTRKASRSGVLLAALKTYRRASLSR